MKQIMHLESFVQDYPPTKKAKYFHKLRSSIRVSPIIDKMQEIDRLKWLGHILRRDETDQGV